MNEGLASLAAERGLHFVRMRPEWYGVDPIHIRPGRWEPAWKQILGPDINDDSRDAAASSWSEGLSLYLMAPERQWLFGVERTSPQSGVALPRGGRVWLF